MTNLDLFSVSLGEENLDGQLPRTSWVRLNRPTVLSEQIMLGRIASVTPPLLATVQDGVCRNIGCTGYLVMESGTPYTEKP